MNKKNTIYITAHAADRARVRIGISSPRQLRDEMLAAMLYGKRQNNNFVYHGVVWCFNSALDALKTVHEE